MAILADAGVTKDDFAGCEWEALIVGSAGQTCEQYYYDFAKAEAAAGANHKGPLATVLKLMLAVCSLKLRPDSESDPLVGHWGPTVADFSREEVQLLAEVASSVKDHDLRARLLDLAWIVLRDRNAAADAVDAYVCSSRCLFAANHENHGVVRAERAMDLAASLGKNNPPFAKAVAHLEDLTEQWPAQFSFITANCMTLLLQYAGNPAKWAALAETYAQKARDIGNLPLQQRFLELAADWHLHDKNEEKRHSMLVAVAEVYVQQADQSLLGPGPKHMMESHWLQKAIEALRKVAGTKNRREELHARLVSCQEKSLAEFAQTSLPVDLGKLPEMAKSIVAGKGLLEALLAFAGLTRPPEVSRLRQEVLRGNQEFIAQFLFASTWVSHSGKVKAHAPAVSGTDHDESSPAFRAQMHRTAQLQHHIHVAGFVEPARQQILAEHYVRMEDFLPLVFDNPLVPEDRAIIFARGLHAGMKGDYLVALHLLVPQVEHAIRHLLLRRGIRVSGLDDEGIQDEHGLTTTLEVPELKQILGEDLVFDLQGLLIEKTGTNLRNEIAHGLMSPGAFHTVDAIYCWALIFRFVCLPALVRERTDTDERDKSGGGSGDPASEPEMT